MHFISILVFLVLSFLQFSQPAPVEQQGQSNNLTPGRRVSEPIKDLAKVLDLMEKTPNQVIDWMTLEVDGKHSLSLNDLLLMVDQLRSYIRSTEGALTAQGKADQMAIIFQDEAHYKPFITYFDWLTKQERTLRFVLDIYPTAHHMKSIGFLMEETIAISSYFGSFMTKEGETPLHRFLFSPVTKLLHRYIDFDHILQFEHQMWTESSTIADFMHSETFFQYRASKGQLLVDPARAVHQTFQDTETKIEDQLRHLRDFKIQALKKKQEALTRGVQSLTKQVSESGIGLESSRVRELPVISHKSLPLPRIRTAV